MSCILVCLWRTVLAQPKGSEELLARVWCSVHRSLKHKNAAKLKKNPAEMNHLSAELLSVLADSAEGRCLLFSQPL